MLEDKDPLAGFAPAPTTTMDPFAGQAGIESEIRAGRALPEDQGIGKEHVKGLSNWARSSVSRIAGAAGSLIPGEDPAERLYRERQKEEEFRGEMRPAKGFWNKTAHLFGQGTGEIASFAIPQALVARGASALTKASTGFRMLDKIQKAEKLSKVVGTAQKATMATVIASRGHGQNYYNYLDKTGNPVVAHLAAFASDTLEYLTERVGGPQMAAERSTRDKILQGLLDATEDTPEVGSMLRQMARGASRSKPARLSSTILKQTLEEVAEEDMSYIGNAMIEAVVTGNTTANWKEFWQNTVDSFGVALPGALFFGSSQFFRQETQTKVIKQLVQPAWPR